MKKLLGYGTALAIIVVCVFCYHDYQENTSLSLEEKQSLRDAPNAKADRFDRYELLGINGNSIAPVPNAKRIRCESMRDMGIFPSLLVVVDSDQKSDPCKLLDQLGIAFPWKKLEASLYGKKPDDFHREEPSGYPTLYVKGEAFDRFGGRWEIGVDPNYVAQLGDEVATKIRDKSLIVDESWKFRHNVLLHPNYQLVVRDGKIISGRVLEVDPLQHYPADAPERKIDQGRIRKLIDGVRNIFQ